MRLLACKHDHHSVIALLEVLGIHRLPDFPLTTPNSGVYGKAWEALWFFRGPCSLATIFLMARISINGGRKTVFLRIIVDLTLTFRENFTPRYLQFQALRTRRDSCLTRGW